MTEREEFLAGLEAEYHDDSALRGLNDVQRRMLGRGEPVVLDQSWVLERGEFSMGVLFPAGTTPEDAQRTMDLWGDLLDEEWPP
jgi:hypothetical protein